ncbi:MAG: putative metal-binding motif-containing protein [Myxococcota bacterium]
MNPKKLVVALTVLLVAIVVAGLLIWNAQPASQHRAADLISRGAPRFDRNPAWALALGEEFWRARGGVGDARDRASLGDIITRTNTRFFTRENDPRPTSQGDAHLAILTERGIRFHPYRPASDEGNEAPELDEAIRLDWDLQSVDLGARNATAIGPWYVDQNAGQRRIQTPAGTVIEHFTASDRGVERSWVLPERPEPLGSLEVATTLSGLGVGPQTDSGRHFVDSDGRARVRIGPAFLVDAAGKRTAIESRATQQGVRYVVPQALLAQATYPVALDPIISPEFGVDERISDHTYSSQRLKFASGSDAGAVVAWVKRGSLQNTLSFARLSPDGALQDRAGRVVSTNASEGWVFSVAAHDEKALIAWVDPDRVLQGALIELASGAVVATQQLDASVSMNAIAIGTNGSDFLVAYDRLKFLRVDGETGEVFAGDVPRARDYSSEVQPFPSIVFVDGHYVAGFVSDAEGSPGHLVSVRIDDTGPGTALELPPVPTVVYQEADREVLYPHLCASGSDLLSVYRVEDATGTRELKGQRLATSGAPIGESFLLQSVNTATGHRPNARCSEVPGRNEFAVTFSNYVGQGGRANVFVQRYRADATLLDERVIGDPTHWSSYAHASALGEGTLIVYGGSPTYPPRHIRYVHLGPDGEPIGDARILTGPPTAQSSLAVAGDAFELIASWSDDRGGSPEVFSLAYDIAGSPLEATVRPESRLAHGAARAHPAVAMSAGGYLVASRGTGGIEVSRVENGALVRTESVASDLAAAPPLALASRATSHTDAVAGVLAFVNEAGSAIHAIALTADGRVLGAPMEVTQRCEGCLGRPSIALHDGAVMIVYRESVSGSEPQLRGWRAALASPMTAATTQDDDGPFGAVTQGVLLPGVGPGDGAVVTEDAAFVVYAPGVDETSGGDALAVPIAALRVAASGETLQIEAISVPAVECAVVAGPCALTAATTGVWDLIAFSQAEDSGESIAGFARRKSGDELVGPFALSASGALERVPAVAGVSGSKFAVGTVEAMDASAVVRERATLRLIDLEEDGDGDGFTPADGDCDDTDAANGLPLAYFADEDGDGYGNPELATEPTCVQPPGHVSPELPPDCDDSDALFGVFEVVADVDGDGFGDQGALPEFGCIGDGFTLDRSDCNDGDPAVNPDAVELASNDIDENCDGRYACLDDQDGDGKVGVFIHQAACGDDYPATELEDCDESNAAVYAGADELVGSGIDEDCDGQELCYADADGDGFGTGETVVSTDADCDDFGESNLDQDCDDTPGIGSDIQGPSLWYPDADGDGYGDEDAEPLGTSCTAIAQGVSNDLDCDDTNAGMRPGAYELCGDAVDQDCDSFADRPGCHADACEGELGSEPYLYQAGVREPDPAYAPDPPPGLTIQGLYLAESEATLQPLENLHFSIDKESGAARLAGRFRVDALNAPGGGGSVGDVWSLNVVMRPATDCGGVPCAPDTDERLNVSEVAHRWRYYTPVVATLSSSELQNPDNKFTYHHILEPAEPGHTVQVGPSASGASLRCGLRFTFIHDSDLRDPAIPDMSGQGELVLDLGAKPGTEAVAVRGGVQ